MSSQPILPVGSVVRLQHADGMVMVIGLEPAIGNEVSDYLGVVYPYGLVTDESALAFDASSIEEVVYEGFCDEEGSRVFSSVRTYREEEKKMLAQVERLVDELTPQRVEELREEYAPAELPDGFEIPEGYQDV